MYYVAEGGVSVIGVQDLMNITDASCIPNLLNTKKPICNIVNSQHFPIIEEISPGVILLNGFSGTLEVGPELQLLNGTFLISFHNASIRVNGKAYTSKEIPTYKALPSILQLMPEEKERKRLVSLHIVRYPPILNLGIHYWDHNSDRNPSL
uniref:Uncharacterized protein n=1 Tax=Glossina austeni TaxID=7395 RepID=A0A1A9URD6_GLOAU